MIDSSLSDVKIQKTESLPLTLRNRGASYDTPGLVPLRSASLYASLAFVSVSFAVYGFVVPLARSALHKFVGWTTTTTLERDLGCANGGTE